MDAMVCPEARSENYRAFSSFRWVRQILRWVLGVKQIDLNSLYWVWTKDEAILTV